MMFRAVLTASCFIVILEVIRASDDIHTISFAMKWKNPKGDDASITCTGHTGKFVHVVTVRGYGRRQTYLLTESELFSLELACSCKEECTIPELVKWRSWEWTLEMEFKCLDTCIICESYTADISCDSTPGTKLDLEYANYGRTATDICVDPSHPTDDIHCINSEDTLETVRSYCQDKVTCELDADNKYFDDACHGTYKYLEVHFVCKNSDKPSTTVRSSSSTAGTTISTNAPFTTSTTTTTTTTQLPKTTATRGTSKTTTDGQRMQTFTQIVEVSTTRDSLSTTNGSSSTKYSNNSSISHDNISPTTDETKISNRSFEFKSDSGKSSTVAIAVSLVLIVVAVSVATSILVFRRWQRKRVDEAVYKNGTAVSNRNDGDGFTSMTYSKVAEKVVLQDSQQQPIDANSNSGDSSYTDMHNEEAENNDYYMIKENIGANSAEIVDDQYYAIKDNVSSEYNEIVFKPKVIPDDSNYGHTLRPGKENVTDETYDHAESGGTLLHAPSQEDINEYSHLNERKPEAKHKVNVDKGRGIPMAKETGDDGLTGHEYFVLKQDANELPADSTVVAGHDYFVLEKGQSQQIDQGTTTVTDTECHDYFVLSKEEPAGDSNRNNSVPKPKDCVTCLKHDTHNETQNDVNDHTYFENPLSTELEDDIHQYQGMDHRCSNTEPENTNHDYFILEKET